MLELKNIKKTYRIGDIETHALDGINVAFREREFVAILGMSGSGKTTCLNIIGGLDRYDSGDLVIKGKSTHDFRDRDWDAYRNNSVGFVFQSYNLIGHLSIVANVEMGMTLSGVSPAEKRARALEVLSQVGLGEHLHKKPNQLSGGQMQRVAIARALANNPEILLCDEPTGALDTATSIQIMDLIHDVAKDRLVIMVTHNPELAEKYADRIIRFQDGKIISDSNPHEERKKPDMFNLKMTGMSFLTALNLSLNNIRTKKGRTFLTAFASSIGIIGIAVILSLSNGFQIQINQFQENALAEFPIIISQNVSQIDTESMMEKQKEMADHLLDKSTDSEKADTPAALPVSAKIYDPNAFVAEHKNVFTDEYMEYIHKISPDICSSIGYTRITGMNIIRRDGDTFAPIAFTDGSAQKNMMQSLSSMSGLGLSSYPNILGDGKTSYLKENYDLIYGEYPEKDTDLVLVIDNKNRLPINIAQALGFDASKNDEINFSEFCGLQIKYIPNDIYYGATEYGGFMPKQNFSEMYNSDSAFEMRITGVVRVSPDASLNLLGDGIAYSDALCEKIIEISKNSEIVRTQLDADYNVLSMEPIDEAGKSQILSYLGGSAAPFMIMIYPTNFENKDTVLTYLDEFNADRNIDDKIVYTDLASTMTSMTGNIMDTITVVLIAFAGISLVVSLIMMCIITYTSVLERTKEIGILRALGARKKDITRVFDAETFILGIFSGILGVCIAELLTLPINAVIFSLTELSGVARLNIVHVILLVIISTVLTVIGGHIPAKMASKRDAVEALRGE